MRIAVMNRSEPVTVKSCLWRHETWLFAGWLAFWLTAVIAPCCGSVAVASELNSAVSSAPNAQPSTHESGAHTHPQPTALDCPDLTAAVGPIAVAAITSAYATGLVPATSFESRRLYDKRRQFESLQTEPSALHGVPLYLSTLRLRI